MLKPAKVINKKTGSVSVIDSDTMTAWGQKYGYTMMEVEKGSDNMWYLAGKAPAADPEEVLRTVLTRLENDLHTFVFTTHDCPQPTQITLQAVYGDPDSTDAQRAACKQIFDWIKTVLAYYYERKKAVRGAADPAAETWNFSDFDATAPGITLAQILGGI